MNLRDFVRKLKDRLDIVEVISSYLHLQKVGKNYRALCPFHAEKTPSFYVNPEGQFYHCFGCGASGDVIKFVQEIEGVSFIEAVERLARRARLSLPDFRRDTFVVRYTNIYRLFKDYYFHKLFETDARDALDYLENERKLTKNDVETFQLGYAPLKVEGDLIRSLKKEGYTLDDAVKYGLIFRKGEDFVHRFAGRITIPIWDENGRVVAFGGRALRSGEPKYLNSPETRFFHKSRTLYLLNKARSVAKNVDFMIVVEGFFDAMALHKAGMQNAVATLGTSLTRQHLIKINSVVSNLLLVFDADEAGIKAGLRAVREIIAMNMSAAVALLKSGKDPDEVLRKHGVDQLVDEFAKAEDYEIFLANALRMGLDMDNVSSKESYLRRVTRWLQVMESGNPERSRKFVEKVSEILGWSFEDTQTYLKKLSLARREDQRVQSIERMIYREEDHLVKLYISNPRLRHIIRDSVREYEEVLDEFGKTFFSMVSTEDFDLNILIQNLSKEMADRIFEIMNMETAEGKEEKILTDCLEKLKMRKIRHRIKEIEEELSKSDVDPARREKLLRERVDLISSLKPPREEG